MTQIALPFNTEEEFYNTQCAIEWLHKLLGDPIHPTDIHHSYVYHKSWRYMSPISQKRVIDHLSEKGGWLTWGDLDFGLENLHHRQQFLIKDPDIAMLFKLTWA